MYYNSLVGMDDDAWYKNVIDPVSASIGGATAIAGTISQIADAKKRRDLEMNLGYLSASQRAQLEKQLAATDSANRRIEILVNAVSNIRAAQSSAILSSNIQAQSKKQMTTAIIIVGGSIALLIAVAILKNR